MLSVASLPQGKKNNLKVSFVLLMVHFLNILAWLLEFARQDGH